MKALRKVEGEKMERITEIFERRAQAQDVLTQILTELRSCFIMLGIDLKTEELDLRTGEVHPLGSLATNSEKVESPQVAQRSNGT